MKNQKRWLSALLAVVMILSLVSGNGAALNAYAEEFDDIILSDTEPAETDETETETEPQESMVSETETEVPESETEPQGSTALETEPEVTEPETEAADVSDAAGTISEWSWNDEEEMLDPESHILALPGASAEQPAYFEDVVMLLPSSITADGEEIPVTWQCDTYPDDGAYEGSYVFTAVLPEGYALAEDAAPLNVTVELGGVMLLATVAGIPYLDADGRTNTCVYATVVDSSGDAWGDSYSTTWYVVNRDVTIESRITVKGDVRLILADGYTLTASAGINVLSRASLTIYGQEKGTGTLVADGGSRQAGIGGNSNEIGSNITINGGTVTATGGEYGAGIGGGYYGDGSGITINGGTVTATGGNSGAGIGGGSGSSGSDITISGGFVAAVGGSGSGSNGAGAAIGNGGSSGTDGTELDESNFNNAVVLRQSGSSSTMTGKVYGNAVLDIDAAVPTDAVLTVPEDTSLTMQSGMTLTNNGTIYVDSELNFGGDYGTLTGTDSVYYWLTVVDGSATEGAVTYPATDGKTYAAEGAGVTLAPDSKEGQICIRWETSVSSVTVTNHSFTMPASILTVTAQYYPAVSVDYLDYVDGGFEAKNTMAIPLTADMTALGSASTEIWYVVNSDVTIASRIAVGGDVHLILADGYTLTASKGIGVPMDRSLTIYGQENGSGALTAVGDGAEAGIGGNMGSFTTTDGNNGPITINGGIITATGGGYGAGIGGGYFGSGSSITINGGTVTATGGISAAGIGGGGSEDGSQITIRGGTVTAVAGDYSAGIGGGEHGTGSQITIRGGFVVAVGGSGSGCDTGAAIGGGGYEGGDVNTAGTEIAESNFTNAVVLRQSGSSGSAMTGKVYGTAVLDTDATVPTDAALTVPEDTSLTLQSGMTLENSGTIYVDSELNFGGSTYGTLTGTGSVYYWLTVKDGSATAGTVTHPAENGKTYAKEKASVTLAPKDKEGQVFRSWESSNPGVTVTNHSFTMPASPLTVTAYYWTAIQADYLGYVNGSFEKKNVWAIPLTSDMSALGMADAETWYVVNSDVIIESRITVSGDVHLILADGCTLTASQGINVPSGSSLTIYGQESGTGRLTANGGTYQAGIGGNKGGLATTAGNNGPITINGGTVAATGGTDGAGIGGGQYGKGSQITINGGTVTATGGGQGTGIGGGYNREGSNITINGGTVMAKGNSWSAGIGGSYKENGVSITISGGTVTATGGSWSAGIGGGYKGNGDGITISGGTVTAKGGAVGAGIGGGYDGSGNSITISGGFVAATGGPAAGEAGAGAAIGDGGSSGTDGTETAESNFTNAVVLRQSGSSSTMTGKVYGTAVLDTNAAVPTGAVLTVPESTSLTLQSGMTLQNNGTIYVDSVLTFGGGYGTLTGTDSVYYWLTVVDGSATTGTVTYPATDGKTYAKAKASVTVAPEDKEGQTFIVIWESDVSGVMVTDNSFTMPASPLTVTAQYWPAIQVDYLDYADGNFEKKQAMAIPMTVDMTALGSAGAEIWYVVNSNLTIESRITVSGDVRLILADGCTLTASQGISVTARNSSIYNSLTIYGQKNGTGALTANGGTEQAGIGGGQYENGRNITINGGTVTATGGNEGAGIGGGIDGDGYNITINGGTVTATGGDYGAGIGGGGGRSGHNITINGGTVTATGGDYGAGIGGSSNGRGYSITINGGTVTATGRNNGAGIGGGSAGAGYDITINGGFVTAVGGSRSNSTYGAGAAIGDGGSSGTDGTETEESNFTNAVVLRQSGSSSTMTGKVYGNAGLNTDAAVPTDAVLTVPEDTSLTLQSGMTLTNSGTIYVDSMLNFGGGYGTLTGTDSVYYWLTVVDGSATAGTVTYPEADGKTYTAVGASVTLTPDSKEGETFSRWETSVSGVTVTNHSFIMPASPLTVTAVFGDTVSVDIIWGAMNFTYTDGAWDPDTHTNDGGGWTDGGSGWFSVENNGGKPVNVAYTYTTARTDISGSLTDGTDPVSEPVTLAVDETKKLWLILSGKPDGELNNTELGIVTVSITGS